MAEPMVMLARAALVVLFLVVAWWRQDPATFGYFHDDTLYFASAQALATGQGYSIPSVPGTPAQTKYPILYPLLLAGVWKLSPQFPDNLALALGLSAVCGAVLVAGWLALAQQLGASRREAAVVAALAAVHPFTLSLTGAVLSDIPFMALAVWAVVLAHRKLWWAAALCSSAAVATRSIGWAVVVGLVAAAVWSRAWRQAAVVAALAVPVAAAGWWWASAHQIAPDGLAGYRQTLLFYTSYASFWRLSVPDLAALGSLAAGNAWEILQAPAALCLPLPHLPDHVYLQGGVAVMLSLAIGWRILRLGRHPVQFVLLFYVGVTLLWNYPLANRFLVVFLPLFWLGALRAAQAVRARAGRPAVAVLALLALEAAYGYFWVLPGQLSAMAAGRSALAAEKAQAYQWITTRTAPAERFIAYEDVSLYLHTGRQALRPIAPRSPARLERDLPGLADTARQIRARYWLVSAGDYQLEASAAALQERTRLLLQPFPVVFRSRGGRVSVVEVAAY